MNDEEMCHYSAALDEIYRLRRALAYEARVVETYLDYKSFPKTRRGVAEEQIKRMRASVIGGSESAYGGVHHRSLDVEAGELGFDTLTRWEWENKRPGVALDATEVAP